MNWSAVKGSVIKSIKKIEYTESGKLECADIVYEYVFGEKKYTSHVVKIGGDLMSTPSRKELTEADNLLNRYPVGKIVDVYVNPEHPKVACLEKAGAETIFVSLFFGALAIVAGLYFEQITDLF